MTASIDIDITVRRPPPEEHPPVWRMAVTAKNAANMPNEIFRIQIIPPGEVSSTPENVFSGVCSLLQLSELSTDPAQSAHFFRVGAVELDFPSGSMLALARQLIVDDIQLLVHTANAAGQPTEAEELSF